MADMDEIEKQLDALIELGNPEAKPASPKTKKGKGGYKDPPVDKQWQKGRSGNPGGRPKGAVSLKKMIFDSSQQLVKVNIGGEIQEMPMIQATIYKLWERAGSKGDIKIFKYLAEFYQQMQIEVVKGSINQDRLDLLQLQFMLMCGFKGVSPEEFGLTDIDLDEAFEVFHEYKDSLPDADYSSTKKPSKRRRS